MANIIKLKRGLSANIASAPLVEGEVALTTDTLELYTRKDNQNVKLTQKGESGVYIGTEAPTDPDINVWIDPSGDGEQYATKEYVGEAIDNAVEEAGKTFANYYTKEEVEQLIAQAVAQALGTTEAALDEIIEGGE
jgi:hypothetical protein